MINRNAFGVAVAAAHVAHAAAATDASVDRGYL